MAESGQLFFASRTNHDKRISAESVIFASPSIRLPWQRGPRSGTRGRKTRHPWKPPPSRFPRIVAWLDIAGV